MSDTCKHCGGWVAGAVRYPGLKLADCSCGTGQWRGDGLSNSSAPTAELELPPLPATEFATHGSGLHTDASLRAYARAAQALALERAAVECDKLFARATRDLIGGDLPHGEEYSAAIRALKGKL